MAIYELWQHESTGERVDVITAIDSLNVTRVVCDIGKMTFRVPFDDRIWKSLRKEQQFVVWRNGVMQFATQYGLARWRAVTDARGIRQIECYGECLNRLLNKRIVAYPAGSPQSDKTGKVDDIMKAIVRENMGELAEADRQIPGLTVESDYSIGEQVSKAFAWRNLFTVEQELHELTLKHAKPMYWDMRAESFGDIQFKVYENMIGIDRRTGTKDTKPIGEQYGNLEQSMVEYDTTDEATAIWAGGQGQEDERVIKTAFDLNRALESYPFGWVEKFRDARQSEAEDSIEAQAQQALNEAKRIVRISGRLIETEGLRYNRDYNWGDIVTAEAYGLHADCMIKAVGLSYSGGQERIDVQLEGVLA